VDYDAELGPDPRAWAAVDADERVAVVEAHHRALTVAHPAVSRPRVHAAIHVVVEDQLLSGDPPQARRALDRLVSSGRSRHEAIHAIASAAADALNAAVAAGHFDRAGYARALDALGADGAPA
jgi:hypothetical protein